VLWTLPRVCPCSHYFLSSACRISGVQESSFIFVFSLYFQSKLAVFLLIQASGNGRSRVCVSWTDSISQVPPQMFFGEFHLYSWFLLRCLRGSLSLTVLQQVKRWLSHALGLLSIACFANRVKLVILVSIFCNWERVRIPKSSTYILVLLIFFLNISFFFFLHLTKSNKKAGVLPHYAWKS
jgi:hypothetical protein